MQKRTLGILLGWMMMVMASYSADNILVDPNFQDPGLPDWQRDPSTTTLHRHPEEGVLEIEVPDTAPLYWYMVRHDFPAQPGDKVFLEAETRGENLHDGHGIIFSVGFFDAERERIAHDDMYIKPHPEDWTPAVCRAVAPEGTASASAWMLMHGFGNAFYRNPVVRHIPASETPTPESITVTVTDEISCKSLIGFGAEDDGWFYNPHNAEMGVNEEDVQLREGRIRWMDPDFIRMFFWYHDWDPELDGNYTWDSPNMESHYRTLELYEELGAIVTIAGVEWTYDETMWANLDRWASSIGDLLEHLKKEKGFDCVKYWTLTNEPNLFLVGEKGLPFETYVEMHRLVRQEIEKRNLDVKIAGVDDGMGLPFFAACVQDDTFFEATDVFVSHHYFTPAQMPFVKDHYRDRLDLLETKNPVKPFVVGEFGVFDERTTPPAYHPGMADYGQAVDVMGVCVDALNAGVAGMAIWCLHRVYYPGAAEPMGFGLWEFKDKNWEIRPVYHAMASLMRLTNSGDRSFRCESPLDTFKIGRVENTLFWTNQEETTLTVHLENFSPHILRVFTEDTVEGDRLAGKKVQLGGKKKFTAPPRSFGTMQELKAGTKPVSQKDNPR